MEDLTKQLLYSIAYHLAFRDDMGKLVYKVRIEDKGNTKPYQRIYLDPNIEVFPNRYKKCRTDKKTLLLHIIEDHFKLAYNANNSTYIDVKKRNFVPGTYIYDRPYNSKKRNWSKEEVTNNED